MSAAVLHGALVALLLSASVAFPTFPAQIPNGVRRASRNATIRTTQGTTSDNAAVFATLLVSSQPQLVGVVAPPTL
jgi:hypothetical protein